MRAREVFVNSRGRAHGSVNSCCVAGRPDEQEAAELAGPAPRSSASGSEARRLNRAGVTDKKISKLDRHRKDRRREQQSNQQERTASPSRLKVHAHARKGSEWRSQH
jgi:hypothetical protein